VQVLDGPDVIVKKFRSAVTDSGREVVAGPDKPGITNLLEIFAAVRGVGVDELEREFDGAGYGAFKQAVADAIVGYLAPVRERHVVVARGRDYADVPPLRGIIYTNSKKSVIDVAVDVVPYEGDELYA